jgi:Tfp pilus assembly protein PilN
VKWVSRFEALILRDTTWGTGGGCWRNGQFARVWRSAAWTFLSYFRRQTVVEVDFLPERIRNQRLRTRRVIRRGCLVVLCSLALVALGYMRQGSIQKAQAELKSLRDSNSDVQRQLRLRQDLERQQAQMQIMKRVDDLQGSQTNALDVLAEVTHLMPVGIALTNLNFEAVDAKVPAEGNPAGAARAAGASGRKTVVKRVYLTVTGLAPSDVDVANFIGQLSASPLLEDVNMAYARNVEFRDRTAREFQVSCYLAR